MIKPMDLCDAFLSRIGARQTVPLHGILSLRRERGLTMIAHSNRLRRTAGPAAVVLAVCLAGTLPAMTQANPPQQPSSADQQKPAPKPPAQSNPFPEDTNNIPVLPNGNTSVAPAPAATAAAPPALPADDADPVRSPDDPVAGPPSSSEWSDSASEVPMDRIAPPPDEDHGKKHRKGEDQLELPEVHKETAKEDESAGGLYLDEHDWKGALSRFESAVVLDPDNPDVYWGLAEAQRNLGQFAAAKGNYLKVMEYDPDSKHAKEAKKRLKEPELANAAAGPAGPRQ
jgi:tetratricopeptide (TPR) repeat protein